MVSAMLSMFLAGLFVAVLLYLGSARQQLLAQPLRWYLLVPLVFIGMLWLGWQAIEGYGIWPGIYLALTLVMALLLAVPVLFCIFHSIKAIRRLS